MIEYNFDISFLNVPNDNVQNSELSETMEATLTINIDNIELRIFTGLDRFSLVKLLTHLENKSFSKLSNLISTHCKEDITIDLSNSMLLSFSTSVSDDVISISLDSVKIHQPINSDKNTATFHLNEVGFNFVKHFYSFLSVNENVFELKKRTEEIYEGYNCKVFPGFSYNYSSSRDIPEMNITKIPTLNFEFELDENMENLLKKVNSIITVCSFFMHSNLEYYRSTIHFKNTKINEYKILKKTIIKDTSISFRNFSLNWKPSTFLSESWKKEAFDNFDKLEKIIKLFNQALIVDDRSKLLIRYNIIEICMGGTTKNGDKFKFTENKDEIYEEAFKVLQVMIPQDELIDFKTKWSNAIRNMDYKPMKSPLVEFLKSNNLPLDELPVKFDEIKKMRDCITHGSIKIKPSQLNRTNVLLYRISGILILNLLGIKDWTFDTHLKE
ncbi:hypothetical protein C3L50_10715 [Flavobacterium alvei]|uniref:ApeA N-terminal domain-containing protein n=1 Tax=Flavobacterium alvei TaxID=2080416 RepID=A0A2S5AAR6_9FLAO|nr:hypothetical protein [Flavobacterium alvei]POY39624.1 hypothetical protein C3L50_10715 [Flavobacterium alvei]